MPAYVIVQVTVKDPERFERYKTMTPPTIAKYDGRYIARGGRQEVLEGKWPFQRTVILEFPTLERAKQWHDSPEYAEALALRLDCTESNMLVLEGL